MTKKAKRGRIMEAVGSAEHRIEPHTHDGSVFSYKRTGDLLKVELKAILEHLDAWNGGMETKTKYAWRRYVRDAAGIEYDDLSDGYERFSEGELQTILEAVRDER